MGAAEEFPVLIGSKNVSPIILDFLEAIRAGSSDKVAISTRLSSRLDAGALKRIPDLVEALLGGEHPEFAKVLHRLAIMHHSRGDFVGAEVLYRRALDVSAKAFLKPTEEWGLMLNNLGRLLMDKNRLGEAERFFLESISELGTALGPEHPKVATPIANLAKLYTAQTKSEEAERCFKDAVRILEKNYGPTHPNVVRARERLEKSRKM